MGWKAACILTGDCKKGYLGTLPKHQPEKCAEVIEKLGYGTYAKVETTVLECGLYPPSGRFAIGAYENAVYIADQDRVAEIFEKEQFDWLSKALTLYPSGNLLAVFLHSVTGAFGYSYYENGELLRSIFGDGEGVIFENGDVQPEEEIVFEKSYVKDGVRYFHWVDEQTGHSEELTTEAYGEELAFSMMTKFFKKQLDEAVEDTEDPIQLLEMDLFEKKLGFWQKMGIGR